MENKLSFIDYFNLREAIEHNGQQPSQEITSSNKVQLTYEEAYKAMQSLKQGVFESVNKTVQISTDVSFSYVAVLVEFLVDKGLLTEEDMVQYQKQLEQEIQKGGNYNE